jgi:V8-like Glu-specific endopeptidase
MQAATPAEKVRGGDGTQAKAAPLPWTSQEVTTPYTAAPTSTHGKVFFTLGGSDYVCSGNAISAANKNTVVTAGHCVNEGPGSFASRFTFVPAYLNGSAPYGQWSATDLYAPTQWASGGDITYDTGFATVSPPSGSSLSDTVGASGVSFNNSRGLTYTAFGYPAAPPFTGETLQSCNGRATDDPFGQSQSQGIPCDMTGGSSGGPWFIGSGSGGTQNSINSFGYDGVANTMFGPYWGSVIQSTYAAASS